MKKHSTFSLKDQLFNTQTVLQLAGRFFANDPAFDTKGFVQQCVEAFPRLELKQRISHIAHTLYSHLSPDYPTAVHQIIDALPPILDPTRHDDDFGEFIIASLSEYIATYGCTLQYLDVSRHALTQITMRFSAEFAVRKFINTFPEYLYTQLERLSHSTNYHQRRLVSEGSRLTLPWAEKITVWSPEQIISLLDGLYGDPTRYVVRSVANNLNALSKKHPKLVLQTLTGRKHEGKQSSSEFDYLQSHALRTLLKSGHQGAYQTLGYTDPSHLQIHDITVSKTVVVGEYFQIAFNVLSDQGPLGKCDIRYSIGSLRASGTHSSTVYKITQGDYNQQTLSCTKRQPLRLMTTRSLYPGLHTRAVSINGVVMKEGVFDLIQ